MCVPVSMCGRVLCVQVIEGDLQDANWRPKPGFDGTPPESAADVLTRMRQLLSVLETQYSGEDIVIIAPDSECLSVLQVRRSSLLTESAGSHRAQRRSKGALARQQQRGSHHNSVHAAVCCPCYALQAAVLGLDLRRHSELAMRPGEVRPLLLSRQQPDLQPMTLPCPRPPACM
jgi:hypothetical protein